MQHVDEAELAAGRVQVGEASILWHNEVDIEVDIEASEGPAVAAWSLLEASRPPVDLSGTCCSGPLDHMSTTIASFPLKLAPIVPQWKLHLELLYFAFWSKQASGYALACSETSRARRERRSRLLRWPER